MKRWSPIKFIKSGFTFPSVMDEKYHGSSQQQQMYPVYSITPIHSKSYMLINLPHPVTIKNFFCLLCKQKNS